MLIKNLIYMAYYCCRSVAIKFEVGMATAFRALRRVTYALHCISPRFIKWPRGQDAVNIMERFQRSSGFPNVIGAIDGTHIKIRAPLKMQTHMLTEKGFIPLTFKLYAILEVYLRIAILGSRDLFMTLEYSATVARFLELPEEYFPNNSHIIGDAAYGIHPHIMVPFRNNGHLTMRQRNFNFCLSSTRMAIERAIGQLKIRFRILLDCLPLLDIKKVPEFIIACCILHNICLLQNDEMLIGIYQHDEQINLIIYENAVNIGNEKRNTIMNALPMRVQ